MWNLENPNMSVFLVIWKWLESTWGRGGERWLQSHSLGCMNIFPENGDLGEPKIGTVREVFMLGEEWRWTQCNVPELGSEGDKWLFNLETGASLITWTRVLSVAAWERSHFPVGWDLGEEYSVRRGPGAQRDFLLVVAFGFICFYFFNWLLLACFYFDFHDTAAMEKLVLK